MTQVVSKDITAQNTFTDWLTVERNRRFSLNIDGTFVAIVTLQMTYDNGVTIFDDDITYSSTFADASEPMAELVKVRLGVKTGDFTSGTVKVRLGRA